MRERAVLIEKVIVRDCRVHAMQTHTHGIEKEHQNRNEYERENAMQTQCAFRHLF